MASRKPAGTGLVVDDEFLLREISPRTINFFFGCRVLAARDGAEPVALHARQGPQIARVITSVMMPVMDGVAAIQVLVPLNSAVRTVVAGGIDPGDSVPRTRFAGVKHSQPKPCMAEALLKAVHEALERPATR